MKGACHQLLVARSLVPLWNLSVVMEVLCHYIFEHLEAPYLKLVSLKMALLLALTMAKYISKLQALSVSSSCLQFAPGLSEACLCPNLAFVVKVVDSAHSCPTLELMAFHPPPLFSEEVKCSAHIRC